MLSPTARGEPDKIKTGGNLDCCGLDGDDHVELVPRRTNKQQEKQSTDIRLRPETEGQRRATLRRERCLCYRYLIGRGRGGWSASSGCASLRQASGSTGAREEMTAMRWRGLVGWGTVRGGGRRPQQSGIETIRFKASRKLLFTRLSLLEVSQAAVASSRACFWHCYDFRSAAI